MATTMTGAVDEMLGKIKTAWDANAQAAISSSYAPALVFEANEKDYQPHPAEMDQAWGRAVIRHGGSRQTTMGKVGSRRFERTGTIWVQTFVPWVEGADLTLAEALARVARNAYEGERSDNVTFTGVTLQERGRDGRFFRWDCMVQFAWYEIR